MKLSDYVARFLEKQGVKYIFGYQGGSITHLIESISETNITYVQNYNEQGSAMAADGYARISEEDIGVAIASNGPGATNLITGVANAYCDSIPTLFLTGQVHTWAMKGKRDVRQESFQEIDIISIVKPITKYAVTVMDKNSIRYELEKALFLAKNGRKGPVFVDIPVDIQGMQIEENELIGYYDRKDISNNNMESVLSKIDKLLEISKKPIILVGGGVTNSTAREELRKFIEYNCIPTVCSLQGLDVVNHDNKAFIGYIGSYGNRYANIALQNADVVLVLGSRLDMRQIGKNKEKFACNAKIIHIDIDESELNHNVNEYMSVNIDVNKFIIDFSIYAHKYEGWKKWLNIISSWKNELEENLDVNIYVKTIGKILDDNTVVVSDVGQNQMWIAQSLRINGNKNKILNSGGLGAMGYSLPASIGAYYASPERTIISFSGDGGIQMNIQELALIGSEKLPIKVFIFNNYSLGLIREIHEKYYNNNCIGSIKGFSQPNFSKLAEAYNLGYKEISSIDDLNNIKTELFDEKPYIFNIIFNEKTYVRPELLGMNTIDEQSPELPDEICKKIRLEVE